MDLAEGLPKFALWEMNGRYEKLQYHFWGYPHQGLSSQLYLPVGLGFSGLQGSFCAGQCADGVASKNSRYAH